MFWYTKLMENIEVTKTILAFYSLSGSGLEDYKHNAHDPDMWSSIFSIDDKRYLLVELEAVSADLQEEEYSRIEDDLNTARNQLKLISPKLEQLHTTNNQAGIGIDGHKAVIDADDSTHNQYKNPNELDTDTVFVLFEVS